MYGVPKFRENFFMKYKKEVMLSVGAFLTIVTVVKFSPSTEFANVKAIDSNRVTIEQQAPVIGYKMIINGTEVGIIADENEVEDLLTLAYDDLVGEIGYDPDIMYTPALIPVREGELTLETNQIVSSLKDALYSSLDVVKTAAYVMRIGDTFTVALESEAAIKEVLEKAQANFVSSDVVVEINFDANEHNSLVMTPKVLMKSEASAPALSTAGSGIDSIETAGIKPIIEKAAEAAEAPATDETEKKDNGKVVALKFAEDIAIVKAFVDPKDIVNVKSAVELITKENEKEKIYTIQEGDCPSTIASNNGMKLTELYKMNPGLEQKQTSIKPGDAVVVSKPESELKIEATREISYKEPILKGTKEVSDSKAYVGTSEVVESGSDGVMEVTALVKELNGVEIDREITATKVLEEAKDKVVSKGTKQFPVTGPTGNYIYPVSGYRISSPFGYRWGSLHTGVDLAVPTGTTVNAIDGGKVIFAGWKSSSYGYFVEIDHGSGVRSRYAHLSKVQVKVGTVVAKGEKIAKSGSTGNSTGPHVHLELLFNGAAVNPVKYLNK